MTAGVVVVVRLNYSCGKKRGTRNRRFPELSHSSVETMRNVGINISLMLCRFTL